VQTAATDLEDDYSRNEDADNVKNGENQADCAEYGSLGRHVTTVDKLIVVVMQLSTIQRRAIIYHLTHTVVNQPSF